ncbi:Ankyrin repeat domain-containing protein 13C-B [Echinococcus granulosus]|uniref:Ankyrin repeat containing protein n=1 Tax=Echinococcus granulosus TaxID=6210 RepID=U6J8Y9_ECHGR|nr:Ankyrin repeat domain-containing protein 13C-B [Echinococcus granulosus]EUB60751.1 Ankyrin repeat domain-containing protein 13C-B [Echinococcus granulosus]CDS18885.1 Ankyrin repeat containing protein [Echinococcus granulosus]
MEIDEEYPLHSCAFHGSPEFEMLIRNADLNQINKRDPYVRQGYLLFREQLSNNGQSSLISQNLLKIPDCILDFRWEFRTWVPFLARHLPSDNCRLFKKDNLIRLDTTLLDFKNRSWVRGQLSIIVDGNKPFKSRTCLIDHEHRSYQILDGTMARENSDEWLNETVQTSLHMPLIRMHMDFTRLSCKKETSKLPWLKDNVPEKIGPYNTQNYSINHVKISVKKRSEHLTKEDVRFLSTLHSHIKQGTVNSAVKLVQDRASVVNEETADGVKLPRLTPRVTWRTYRSWKLQGNDLYIGRKPVLKLQTNEMKLNVAMTNEIDFNITYLLDMFKCFSPLRKFTKLDETILSSLPPGFPVRIDVPVSPGITGRVTFKSVELCEGDKMTNSGFVLRDELFKIPMGYISSDVL